MIPTHSSQKNTSNEVLIEGFDCESTPFDYQQDALNAINKVRSEGQSRALVQMATGLGKTWVAAFEAKKLLEEKPDARVLFLAHQNEILNQSEKTFSKVLGEDISTGLFNGDEKTFDSVNCLFASFQTMSIWREGFLPDDFDYVIVDEGHHSSAETYEPTINYFNPKFLLGVTATPDRHDGRDIRDIYGEEVFKLPLEEALVRGLLSKVDYRLLADEIQLDNHLETTIGSYSVNKLNRKIFVPKRDQEIARIINEHSAEIESPRRIIFCPSIEYTERFAKMIDGCALHSDMPNGQQRQIIQAFKDGSINTILTIDKFNEGIDIPEANQIVFLRSTQSKTVFLQQLGRGLRKTDSKESVQVLDFAMNCERVMMINELWEHIQAASQGKSNDQTLELDLTRMITFNESAKDVIKLLKRIGEGYSEESLVQMLQALGESLGKRPSLRDAREAYRAGVIPAPEIFIYTFGHSWVKALQAAGFNAKLLPQSYTREDLIERIVSFHEEYGKLPDDESELKMYALQGSMPHPNTFRNTFGSWKKAVEAAGLTYEGKYRTGTTDEDIVKALQDIYAEKRTPLSVKAWQEELKKRNLGASAIRRRFVNWNNALVIADIPLNQEYRRDGDNRKILTELNDLMNVLGHTPTSSELAEAHKQQKVESEVQLKKRFGTLGHAAVLAVKLNKT